jgi:hypothetical protein
MNQRIKKTHLTGLESPGHFFEWIEAICFTFKAAYHNNTVTVLDAHDLQKAINLRCHVGNYVHTPQEGVYADRGRNRGGGQCDAESELRRDSRKLSAAEQENKGLFNRALLQIDLPKKSEEPLF